MRVLATTNDVFETEGKHYITIFVVGVVKEGEDVVPVVSLFRFLKFLVLLVGEVEDMWK